ncbi:MAG TPA: helix-turn-helix transcriptional regulator [Candidatus Xenobia bacterium]
MDAPEIKRRIGLAIRERRLERGLTQEHVAFEAGINSTYLSDVERGKRNIAAVNLVQIAAALGTTATELFRSAGL